MKKTFLILSVIMLALASCKKDYTCTCTYVYSNSDGDASVGDPNTVTIKDVKKSTVESSYDCVSYTSTNTIPGYSETETVTCTTSKK